MIQECLVSLCFIPWLSHVYVSQKQRAFWWVGGAGGAVFCRWISLGKICPVLMGLWVICTNNVYFSYSHLLKRSLGNKAAGGRGGKDPGVRSFWLILTSLWYFLLLYPLASQPPEAGHMVLQDNTNSRQNPSSKAGFVYFKEAVHLPGESTIWKHYCEFRDSIQSRTLYSSSWTNNSLDTSLEE